MGLVGESGSGKSVTGLAVLGLIDPPGRIAAGSIRVHGEELVGRSEKDLRKVRGKDVRDDLPGPDDDPEPGPAHRHADDRGDPRPRDDHREGGARAGPARRWPRSASPPPRSGSPPTRASSRVACASAWRSPPRCSTARACSWPTKPTTALDVTIQAQILAEVQKLCAETGTALVWITHDLSVIAGLADKVAVMYAGRIVEEGPVADVLERPIHPYTAGLIGSVPSRNKRGRPLAQIPGMTPSLLNLPAGCPFAPRCGYATDPCRTIRPEANALSARPRCALPQPAERLSRRRAAGARAMTQDITAPTSQPILSLSARAQALREVPRRRRAGGEPVRRGAEGPGSCAPSTTSPSTSRPARSWASSASPAAASPRSGASMAGILDPSDGVGALRGRGTSRKMSGRRAAPGPTSRCR